MRGFAYTLEVLLATAVIVVASTFVFSVTQTSTSQDTALIRTQGLEALQFLDQDNELRILVWQENNNQIKKRLRDLLPSGIAVEADVCDYRCTGNIPNGKTVVSVDYYVSGYRDTYFTRKVKLWMWGNF